MARDDYDVIVCRILVYLYACLKRKMVFDPDAFHAAVKRNVESEEYFTDILRLAQGEGLISGLVFKKVWSGTYLLLSPLSDAEITADGIHYLRENSKMQAVRETLIKAADILSPIILQLFP